MNLLAFRETLCQEVIDLPRAALLFAREIAYPQLACSRYLEKLDALTRAASESISANGSPGQRGLELADFLFNQQGFQGNRTDYNDPQNSFLNDVLDRRLGIPISLSFLYLTLARRLEIPAYGIGMPGHFVVELETPEDARYLDPFNGGALLDRHGCADLVRRTTGYGGPFQDSWLLRLGDDQILARMLNNLKLIYVQRERWPEAVAVVQHLQAVQPYEPRHLRDLGLLHYRMGSPRVAIQLLKTYLQRAPAAEDAAAVHRSLRFVADQYARLN
jgi:regulator of sirC expression with transglutaminase-like and TPR domain